MNEQCMDTLRCSPQDLRQAMSIHTRKITDACRDKDCIEDLQVFLTKGSQALLDNAESVRVRKAELIDTYIDVEPVAFDRNHYCIDVTFFYRILADAVISGSRPACIYGCARFTKRAVLCGEDSRAHIYRSDTRIGSPDGYTRVYANRPTAVVEVLDPMVLSSRVKEACTCTDADSIVNIPGGVCALFDEELVCQNDHRKLYVTLGQFSIIRLERDAQLIVPVLDYAIPNKECCDSVGCCDQDPCEMFSRIPFPSNQFAPRNCDGNAEANENNCGC